MCSTNDSTPTRFIHLTRAGFTYRFTSSLELEAFTDGEWLAVRDIDPKGFGEEGLVALADLLAETKEFLAAKEDEEDAPKALRPKAQELAEQFGYQGVLNLGYTRAVIEHLLKSLDHPHLETENVIYIHVDGPDAELAVEALKRWGGTDGSSLFGILLGLVESLEAVRIAITHEEATLLRDALESLAEETYAGTLEPESFVFGGGVVAAKYEEEEETQDCATCGSDNPESCGVCRAIARANLS